jgi:prevent-host-death family protein
MPSITVWKGGVRRRHGKPLNPELCFDQNFRRVCRKWEVLKTARHQQADLLALSINNDYYDHNFRFRLRRRRAMGTQTWTVAEAKAKFSELIDRAKSEGPQKITKHGRMTAVIVAAEEWERKAGRKDNLAEFLARSPFGRSGLELKRLPVRLRKVEL